MSMRPRSHRAKASRRRTYDQGPIGSTPALAASFGMSTNLLSRAVVISLAVLLLIGQPTVFSQETETAAAEPAAEGEKIPNEQLDSLVAPIALYPDPLLAQTLAASTYPIEIVQLGQWLEKN